MSIQVSFIIVNYKTGGLTNQCIDSIKKFTLNHDYEIIVVDNDSNDGSTDLIKNLHSDVLILESKENLGFGKANNLGVSFAKGKYVLLINSDTYLLNDSISVFWDFMELEKHLDVACCGGDLFDPDGKRQVAFGNFPSLLEAVSKMGFFIFYKDFFKKRINSGVFNYNNEIKEVDYVSGADMFIRKDVFQSMNGFDDDFFLYFEETELSLRFKRDGFKSFILPEAKIVHLEGASQDKDVSTINYSKLKRYYVSRYLYFKKSHGRLYTYTIKFLDCFREMIVLLIRRKGNLFKLINVVVKS